MARILLLVALSLCLLPSGGAAGAPERDVVPAANVLDSAPSEFTLQDDLLILTHHAEPPSFDQAIISADGGLKFNGAEISTDKHDRKLLRKFYQEVGKLDRMNTEFAAEIEVIVKAEVGRDAEGDQGGAIDEKLVDRVAKAVGGVEKSAHRIEAQGERVMKIAAELKKRIPALADFAWNLAD